MHCGLTVEGGTLQELSRPTFQQPRTISGGNIYCSGSDLEALCRTALVQSHDLDSIKHVMQCLRDQGSSGISVASQRMYGHCMLVNHRSLSSIKLQDMHTLC